MVLLKPSLGGFLVSSTTIYSVIFALISLSDYLWVVFEKIGVTDPVIFLMYVMVLTFLTFKYNFGNIRLVYLLFYFVFAFFVILSSIINVQSLSNDAFSVFLSFTTVFVVFIFFDCFDREKKLELLSKTLFFYLSFSLLLEVANKVSGGNNLIIIFQNNLVYLLIVLFFIGKNISNDTNLLSRRYYKISVALTLVYLLYCVAEFGYYRLQFKTIALSMFVLIYFLCYRLLIKNAALFKFTIIFSGLLVFIFSGLLFDRIEDVINSSGRMGSGMLRLEVVMTILNSFQSPADFIFGLGPGASGQEFAIFYSGSNLYLSSHAGIASIFLDYGILGGCVFFVLPMLLMIFKLKDKPNGFYYVFIILFCWAYLNILYISAIPTTKVYNFSMLPFLVQMVVILLSKRECK
uniref:Uncharacterized protein n=1 Tax=Vibrio parahaemolyticus TaxID=670 RepID=A0A7M1W798_VIBPH|nr:hypothetical protein VP35_00021 [Vibrio parahaemolyticus]